MKVLFGEGQMCNLLWSYTPIIAHSLVYKEHVIIIDFRNYVHLFPNAENKKYVYFIYSKIGATILVFFIKVLRKMKFLKDFDIKKKTKGLSYISGWDYRHDFSNTEKVKNEIKLMFMPANDVQTKSKALISEERKDGFLIIGVHLRRGDYAGFLGRKYYYSNENVNNFMQQMVDCFQGEKIKFFLASNEKIELNSFPNSNCFKHPEGSSIDDLYSLSLCDYIIGPPSTYSMWASFYGEKPLLIIDSVNKTINLDDFHVMKACDVFESGEVWRHPS